MTKDYETRCKTERHHKDGKNRESLINLGLPFNTKIRYMLVYCLVELRRCTTLRYLCGCKKEGSCTVQQYDTENVIGIINIRAYDWYTFD